MQRKLSAGNELARPSEEGWSPSGPPGPTPFDWVAYALACVRRRKLIAALVFVAGVSASVAYLLVRTPVYRAEARVLAQRQQGTLSGVGYQDVPTASAWDVIHGRENLVAIVRSTNLLAAAPPSSGKRALPKSLLGFVRGRATRTDEDPVDTLVDILDKRLKVTADEGTVSIELDWPDPQQAYDIVHAALQNFLEVRYLREVKAFDDVISVLRGRAAVLRDELAAAIDASRARTPRPVAAAPARVRQASEEAVRLQSLLEAKQRAIQDVEDLRRRRLAELQAQLDQARNTLSDAHPTVIGLRKDIEAAGRESPQIEALREEERRLRKELADRLAHEGVSSSASAAALAPPPPVEPSSRNGEDQRVTQARVQYEQMLSRVNAAQVELDAARSGFKYRYSVVWPPRLPREPVSPNPKKILPLGFFASLVLAIAAAVAPDVWAGRIVSRWQVDRVLQLPVLGEIHRRR
jgi:uncharacterized protein involved in exopolysaccharide biosynthesis